MATFLGVDLGWFGKPTGLAAATLVDGRVTLQSVERIESVEEILAWIDRWAGGDSVCAVDAPLVIPNAAGIRQGERELNAQFRRFHAGCHPANLGRPFAPYVTEFSRSLEARGFRHGPGMAPQERGRWQIEVHPHAAAVSLFGLDRIVKYKRGRRADRARELARLRSLVLSLPLDGVGLVPEIPDTGPLKPAEDCIDAVLCAYIAAVWWQDAAGGSHVFGTAESGYVVVPVRRGARTALQSD